MSKTIKSVLSGCVATMALLVLAGPMPAQEEEQPGTGDGPTYYFKDAYGDCAGLCDPNVYACACVSK